MNRTTLLAATAAVATTALLAASPARAVGGRVDVQVVDRDTGRTLTPVLHDGEWWVAGRPGARYRIVLANRDGRRTLSVVSVDGVNAISGDTASWNQSGYVLTPFDRTEVDGWRKSQQQVAAFTFAALSDSYAARTGRPGDVGVIGVAVFDERPPVVVSRDAGPVERSRRSAPSTEEQAPEGAPAEARSAVPSPPSPVVADKAAPAPSNAPRDEAIAPPPALAERLGTGHGAIEDSPIQWVAFRRARPTPDEVVTIHYDRLENLIAMGIVARPIPQIAARPPADPFPGSHPDPHSYVPDPPPR